MATKTYQYHWQHVPSGRGGVRAFNATHGHIFADPYGVPEKTIRARIDYLVWDWDQAQPDTWKYWITEEDVCRN